MILVWIYRPTSVLLSFSVIQSMNMGYFHFFRFFLIYFNDIYRFRYLSLVLLSLSLLLSIFFVFLISVQFSSVARSCPTFCDPMNRSTPGLPVHHHLPEFTQTHVHRVRDAIQPSHPRSSPSPPAPNTFQHQSLFQ